MEYFYFARHGQTVWNVENKICGATDIELTEKGHEQAKESFANTYEGGESMLHLCQRIYNLIDDIKKEADDKVYLLVAHNGISRAIQSYFTDMTNEEFAKFGIKNCEIRKFEF